MVSLAWPTIARAEKRSPASEHTLAYWDGTLLYNLATTVRHQTEVCHDPRTVASNIYEGTPFVRRAPSGLAGDRQRGFNHITPRIKFLKKVG